MRRSIALAAALVVLVLPRVAAAQTPSVTPTPAPVMFTFRFDCASVPWSCGDAPTDVRWQLLRVTKCIPAAGGEHCTFEHLQPIRSGDTVSLWPNERYRLFLTANSDRSDRVSRVSCSMAEDRSYPVISFYSQCVLNGTACAGPENWNVYAVDGDGLLFAHKHIGDCSSYRMFAWPALRGKPHIVVWGLPGELTTPTAASTMTPPPPATLTPTAPIPTDAPTVEVTPTASPTAPGVPPATLRASPTAAPSSTATPPRATLLLPLLWK